MKSNIKELSEKYKLISDSYINIEKGWITNISKEENNTKDIINLNISLLYGTKDIVNNTKQTLQKEYNVTIKEKNNIIKYNKFCSFPVIINQNIKLTSRSPTGKYIAYLTINPFILTICDKQKQIGKYELKEYHGDIYIGEREGSLHWSFNENYISYIAEKKEKESNKQSQFWSDPNIVIKDNNNNNNNDINYEKYLYKDDWGEQYCDKRCGHIYVINIKENGKIYKVKNIPNTLTCSDPIWTPENDGIIFTGTETNNNNNRKYGIIYCYNRKSSLFYIPFDIKNEIDDKNEKINEHLILLTAEFATARSPRFSPDGKKLAFLTTKDVITHNTCSALYYLNWNIHNLNKKELSNIKKNVVVDYIFDKKELHYQSSNEIFSFYGIYINALPINCWTNNSEMIIFNTFCGSKMVWHAVLATKQNIFINQYYFQDKYTNIYSNGCSETVLDLYNEYLLIQVSNPMVINDIYIVKINQNIDTIINKETNWMYYLIDTNEKNLIHIQKFELLSIPINDINSEINISNRVNKIKTCLNKKQCTMLYHTSVSNSNYEAIIMIPKGTIPLNGWPILIDIHGGPHGSSSLTYRLLYDFLCSSGYCVMTVNYRGSIGFGLKPLESLVGRVGNQDIADVHNTIDYVIKNNLYSVDKNNIFCSGGSHGGFICAHLISQYPGFYKATCLRNPVINLSSLIVTSDIPDWSAAVAGIGNLSIVPLTDYHMESLKNKNRDKIQLNDEIVSYLFNLSPLSNDFSKLNTPILLGLGAKDRRVPITEGLQLINAIRNNNKIKTNVFMYKEDCHPLDSVEASTDFSMQMILWLEKYKT